MNLTITQIHAAAAVALFLAARMDGTIPLPPRRSPPAVSTTISRSETQPDTSATFSTQGVIDLTGEYFRHRGDNGRSCATCHIPQDAWSINPDTIQRLFDQTGGMHPIFNRLDANTNNGGSLVGRGA